MRQHETGLHFRDRQIDRRLRVGGVGGGERLAELESGLLMLPRLIAIALAKQQLREMRMRVREAPPERRVLGLRGDEARRDLERPLEPSARRGKLSELHLELTDAAE